MEIRETLSTPVKYECGVFVAGGGFAGIAAAAAAARSGKSVLLAERSFMLGGLGTSGLVTIYLPICDGYGNQVSFGLAEELLRLTIDVTNDGKRGYKNWIASDDPSRRTEKDPRFEVSFNPSLFAIRAEQFLRSLGVKILYGTLAVSVSGENDKIGAVILENKSGRFAVKAGSFVDATGDADIAKFAGAPTVEFGEKNLLAAWYYSTSKDERYRLHVLGCCDNPEKRGSEEEDKKSLVPRRFAGLDGEEISEFMQASHDATMRQVLAEREKDPTFEPVSIASIPQLRMTRRIAGEYELDISEAHRFFDDSVGMVSDWRHRGPIFEVPFRTLYSAKVKNLITAGRCTSSTEAMWDVMRVIPCCSVTGEAAGTAAAMTDDFPSLDLHALQEELRSRGVVLHEKDLKKRE